MRLLSVALLLAAMAATGCSGDTAEPVASAEPVAGEPTEAAHPDLVEITTALATATRSAATVLDQSNGLGKDSPPPLLTACEAVERATRGQGGIGSEVEQAAVREAEAAALDCIDGLNHLSAANPSRVVVPRIEARLEAARAQAFAAFRATY